MIAAKTAKGVSDLYIADFRYRLGAFAEAFHCDVSALVPDDLQSSSMGLGFRREVTTISFGRSDVLRRSRKTGLAVERSEFTRARGKEKREGGAG